MKAARDEVSAQLAQVFQAARDLEGQAKILAAGKQTLETSLAKVNQDLDNCKSHNARLCLIADEMLKKQQSRSAVGGILKRTSDSDRQSRSGKVHAGVQGQNRTGEAAEEVEAKEARSRENPPQHFMSLWDTRNDEKTRDSHFRHSVFECFWAGIQTRSLFEAVIHVPLGHPETMKSVIPFASSRGKLFGTETQRKTN